MLAHKVIRQRHIFNSQLNYLLKKYSKQATAGETKHQYEKLSFPPVVEKKPKNESVIFSLLTGSIKPEMLAFPEVLPGDRYKEFHNWLDPIENYVLSCTNTNTKLNKEEVIYHLRELELFRACMEEDHGLNLCETESLRLIEAVSTLPWLGTYLVKNNIVPLKILSKYGSVSQKQEYYPKIATGEIVPTICIHEGDNGTNVNNIKSHAVPIEGKSWLLNGEKTFVVNGVSANLFLVFARTISKTSCKLQPDSFSLFLVEKDNESVVCSEVHETVGRHEIPTCTISFKDVVIPEKNIIGEPGTAFNILLELLKPGEQYLSAQAISILRNFLNLLITDILKTKHFDRDLYQFDIVKNIVSEMIYNLYTMESMAYFTFGLIDKYENQDVTLEKVITERYCVNKCLNGVQAGIQLMGAHSYLNNTSYIQTFHDALALSTVDMNNMDADTYIGAGVIQQIGKIFQEHIYKKRNYHKYPIYHLIDNLIGKAEPDINIAEHFHRSLKFGLENLEVSIKLFVESLNKLLLQDGLQIIDQINTLKVITEMISEIYGGFASLSRSSRSYSLGLRNADKEKDIGVTAAYLTACNINEIAQHIETGKFDYRNAFYKTASEHAYANHRYCMTHPITRATF
ncbi:complex I assembly factor ACAD9, mitochondrial [Megachile rotundata]|uniref:complex I assembly factor ACAD9, mitochondrial n=1 Tax=Megachile rotundata TaxID=143995 RepID=UPI000615414B|nr:PREDICTED: acyl-CoA dehydrogenase family member 9, mitochondrial [Megachile rotundata]